MGMEDETRDFLVLILNTIALVLIWMILQVLLGIFFKLGLFETTPSVKNYLYYVFLVASLILLIRHLGKKWKL